MPAKYSTAPRVAEYIRLHASGLSTAQIADRLRVKKNTVINSLRRYGALRQALGRDVELEVAVWTSQFAHSCYRMPGDHPFDLLVDWQRVDVKSARQSCGYYHFELNHDGSMSDYRQHVDEFYLVLTDTPGRQVYRLNARDVSVKKCLTIPKDPTRSKYPLQLLGHLESEVIV